MNAIVINPWIADFKLYDEWMHPLGLYFLISLLRRNGAAVRYINCLDRQDETGARPDGTGAFPFRPYPKPELYKKIKRRYKLYGITEDELAGQLASAPVPDVVFIGSSMTYWLPGLAETVKAVRRMLPGAPVAVGGTVAQLAPAAVGEACPGVQVYRGTLFEQSALANSGIPFLSSLKALTMKDSLVPAFELLGRAFHGPALASLGCPMTCSYCASRIVQPRYVARPASLVAEELKFMQARWGVGNFAWYDDALLYGNGMHFLDLAGAAERAGVKAAFHAPNGLHVRWLNARVLDAMKRSGFRTLRFGYETGGAAFYRETRGKTTREELAEKVLLARRSGFAGADIGVYVMAGLPGQTPHDVAAEIEFVASLSVKVKPVFLSPVPGTRVYHRYATGLSILTQTPLSHNDSFFITLIPGWDEESAQRIKDMAKTKNATIS
jgi:hypothetical protein